MNNDFKVPRRIYRDYAANSKIENLFGLEAQTVLNIWFTTKVVEVEARNGKVYEVADGGSFGNAFLTFKRVK